MLQPGTTEQPAQAEAAGANQTEAAGANQTEAERLRAMQRQGHLTEEELEQARQILEHQTAAAAGAGTTEEPAAPPATDEEEQEEEPVRAPHANPFGAGDDEKRRRRKEKLEKMRQNLNDLEGDVHAVIDELNVRPPINDLPFNHSYYQQSSGDSREQKKESHTFERVCSAVAGIGAAGCGIAIFGDWFFGDLSLHTKNLISDHLFFGLCVGGGVCVIFLFWMMAYHKIRLNQGCLPAMRIPVGGLALGGFVFSAAALGMNRLYIVSNSIDMNNMLTSSTQHYWYIGAGVGAGVCALIFALLCFRWKCYGSLFNKFRGENATCVQCW